MALSPDGGWIYVTAAASNTVSVIDTKANRVVANFLVDPRPRAAAFSPEGKRAWVIGEIGGSVCIANGHGNAVAVLDAATGKLLANVPVGKRSWGIAFTPDGKKIYTAKDVSVPDAATLKVRATIPAGQGAWGVAIGPR